MNLDRGESLLHIGFDGSRRELLRCLKHFWLAGYGRLDRLRMFQYQQRFYLRAYPPPYKMLSMLARTRRKLAFYLPLCGGRIYGAHYGWLRLERGRVIPPIRGKWNHAINMRCTTWFFVTTR